MYSINTVILIYLKRRFTRVRKRIKILTWIIESKFCFNLLCQTLLIAENLLPGQHYLLPDSWYLSRLWAYQVLVAQKIQLVRKTLSHPTI